MGRLATLADVRATKDYVDGHHGVKAHACAVDPMAFLESGGRGSIVPLPSLLHDDELERGVGRPGGYATRGTGAAALAA
jgi:hypothetical protein